MLNKDVYIDTSGAKLVVKVVFIDFPPTEVNERERSVKNETIYVYGFKRGQSIHFSMLAEDLVAKMKKALLKIGIFKVNDTFPICHIFTHLSGCACDMVRIIISFFKQISICSFLPRIYIYIYLFLPARRNDKDSFFSANFNTRRQERNFETLHAASFRIYKKHFQKLLLFDQFHTFHTRRQERNFEILHAASIYSFLSLFCPQETTKTPPKTPSFRPISMHDDTHILVILHLIIIRII